MSKITTLSALGGLILAACVTSPEPRLETPFADAPSEWRAGESASTTITNGWVGRFNAPLLTALVEEAQANNPGVAAIAASVRRSRGLADRAKAGLSPELLLIGGGSSSGVTGSNGSNTQLTNAGLTASWEPDLWGRIGEGAAAARLDAEAAFLDERAARYLLASSVVDAYVLALEAELQAQVAQRNYDALAETLSFVTIQYERGLRSGRDIALIRSDAANAESSLVLAQNAKRNALRALEILVGRYPGADIFVEPTFPELPALPAGGVPADILQTRPDLIAAELRIDAAYARHKSARAAQRPNLTLTGLIGVDGEGLSGTFDPAGLAWNAAASLAAPVIDGGRRRADVEIAAADIDAAIASYREAVLQAWDDVEQQFDLWVTLRDQEDLNTSALAEAEKALEFTEFAYDIGTADLLDVLALQQRVAALQSQQVAIQSARLIQISRLSLALGTDWSDL